MTISAHDERVPEGRNRGLVVCVLVNWNGSTDTIACLRSLAVQDYACLRVLIVDNASTDDSIDRIREALPDAEILVSSTNRGFAGGCNLGIAAGRAAGASFLWLLNNDTVAPPDTLTRMVAAATANPRAGIVGTVLRYFHDPSQIQAWGGGSLQRATGYVRHYLEPSPLGQESFLTFASVLIRSEVLAQVGPLDERYFMYFEDADFCFRARAAGWQLAVAPDTAVLHKEGASGKRGTHFDRVVTTSGLRFLHDHAPLPSRSKALFTLLRLGKRALRADWNGLRGVLAGVSDWRKEQAGAGRKP